MGGSVIYSQQTQLPTIQEGTTTLTAAGSHHFFVPFGNTQGAVTAMALTNPGAGSATVTVTRRYSDGTMETPSFPSVAGAKHQSFTMPGQFTNTSGRSGVAEYVSSVPLYTVVFRFNPTGAFTALDVVQPGAASPPTRTLSHAGDGSGFKTTVLLTNTAAQAEPFVLRFDDGQGNAPSPPVALELGSLTGMIPAGGSVGQS